MKPHNLSRRSLIVREFSANCSKIRLCRINCKSNLKCWSWARTWPLATVSMSTIDCNERRCGRKIGAVETVFYELSVTLQIIECWLGVGYLSLTFTTRSPLSDPLWIDYQSVRITIVAIDHGNKLRHNYMDNKELARICVWLRQFRAGGMSRFSRSDFMLDRFQPMATKQGLQGYATTSYTAMLCIIRQIETSEQIWKSERA